MFCPRNRNEVSAERTLLSINTCFHLFVGVSEWGTHHVEKLSLLLITVLWLHLAILLKLASACWWSWPQTRSLSASVSKCWDYRVHHIWRFCFSLLIVWRINCFPWVWVYVVNSSQWVRKCPTLPYAKPCSHMISPLVSVLLQINADTIFILSLQNSLKFKTEL